MSPAALSGCDSARRSSSTPAPAPAPAPAALRLRSGSGSGSSSAVPRPEAKATLAWCRVTAVFVPLLPNHTSPILSEKDAKQMLRTRREDRPRKAGFPDEPMREYMLYLQHLEQRSEEQFLEHWLNPHCLPHCNRDLVHPI